MDTDVEKQLPTKLSHFHLIFDHARVTREVLTHQYEGSGTKEDPYITTWIPNDPGNPMEFSKARKWGMSTIVAISMLAVAFNSSAYSGGIEEILFAFDITTEVSILGVSLFVLGFALGPLIWAPASELYGRQLIFLLSFGPFTAFTAGATGSKNIQTLLVLRFFAGAFGSSPLTNAGGQISDIFTAAERGLALGLFALAPFLGPSLGPIAGGFLGESAGWKWVFGLMSCFAGVMLILSMLFVPETYAPVLLRKRSRKLSALTGKVYQTQADAEGKVVSPAKAFSTSLLRPWVLLFKEPIVLLLSVYMAIIYGTLYMLFAAYPIVYQEKRGWSEGIGGLAFLAVAVGMVFAIMLVPFGNVHYMKAAAANGGHAPPEARLITAMVGSAALPIGLFWFAWTNSPKVFWFASVAAGAPFGFGMVMVFLAITNYLIDSYTVFAASVLAANSLLRSLFGFAFPLFTTYMYQNLGIHWASCIPAFLALACVPFPFLFYKYGAAIRSRCVYAAQSEAIMRSLLAKKQAQEQAAVGADVEDDTPEPKEAETPATEDSADSVHRAEEADEVRSLERVKTARSFRSVRSIRSARSRAEAADYQVSPYDLDLVNTQTSISGLDRTLSQK